MGTVRVRDDVGQWLEKCGRPKGGSTGREGIREGFLEEVAPARQEGRRGKVGEPRAPLPGALSSSKPSGTPRSTSRRPGLGAELRFPALTSAGSDLSAEGAGGSGPAPIRWRRPMGAAAAAPPPPQGMKRRLRVPLGRASAADERAPQELRDPRTLSSQSPAAAAAPEPRT